MGGRGVLRYVTLKEPDPNAPQEPQLEEQRDVSPAERTEVASPAGGDTRLRSRSKGREAEKNAETWWPEDRGDKAKAKAGEKEKRRKRKVKGGDKAAGKAAEKTKGKEK